MQQLSIDIQILGILHRRIIKLYPKPSRQIAFVVDICQVAALIECLIAYARHTFAYRNICHISAKVKRIRAYAHHSVPDCDACQIIGLGRVPVGRECIITYTHHAIGDCYACQTATIVERIITYARYAVGDCYACQTATIVERIITYARYAVGDCYACQTATIVERVFAYLFRPFRNNNISLQQLSIDIEIVGISHRIRVVIAKVNLRPSRQITFIVYICQAFITMRN